VQFIQSWTSVPFLRATKKRSCSSGLATPFIVPRSRSQKASPASALSREQCPAREGKNVSEFRKIGCSEHKKLLEQHFNNFQNGVGTVKSMWKSSSPTSAPWSPKTRKIGCSSSAIISDSIATVSDKPKAKAVKSVFGPQRGHKFSVLIPPTWSIDIAQWEDTGLVQKIQTWLKVRADKWAFQLINNVIAIMRYV
jgi:hypothetical protein